MHKEQSPERQLCGPLSRVVRAERWFKEKPPP